MNVHAAQLVEKSIGKPWDLGSIPRSPTLFHIFLPNVVLCSLLPEAYHAALYPSVPHVSEHESNGPDLRPME